MLRHSTSSSTTTTMTTRMGSEATEFWIQGRSNVWNPRHKRSKQTLRQSLSTNSNGDRNDEESSHRSARAARVTSLLPSYLTDARSVQLYHPVDCPNGTLQLSVAENRMFSSDLLLPAIQRFSSSSSSSSVFMDDMIYYQPTHGRLDLRLAMAQYLQKLLSLSHQLDVDGLVCGSGCNAVLENLCMSLADHGDVVLLPSPYYAAFEFDLGSRAGLEIMPVNTVKHYFDQQQQHPDSKTAPVPIQSYYPTTASLTHARNQALASGKTPKILLLCHPNNPLGRCYPKHVMKECMDWCRQNQIHLISDEIYAGSVYRNIIDDNHNDDSSFESILSIASSSSSSSQGTGPLGLGPYVHFVYALSKDFALSGLRVGVSYSENQSIRLPLQKLNDLCQISSQTQSLVQQMLSSPPLKKNDDDKNDHPLWSVDEFLVEARSRLYHRCSKLESKLQSLNITYLSPQAGMFLWMDLREFLPQQQQYQDEEAERILYLELMNDFGLLFTPGLSMKHELPGFFRFVFTAATDKEFDLALNRLDRFVQIKREHLELK